MKVIKWNRRRKVTVTLKKPDALGNPRRVVVYYDDLSRAKNPPAWMKELLFSDNVA